MVGSIMARRLRTLQSASAAQICGDIVLGAAHRDGISEHFTERVRDALSWRPRCSMARITSPNPTVRMLVFFHITNAHLLKRPIRINSVILVSISIVVYHVHGQPRCVAAAATSAAFAAFTGTFERVALFMMSVSDLPSGTSSSYVFLLNHLSVSHISGRLS
jgi:hypothetical protein